MFRELSAELGRVGSFANPVLVLESEAKLKAVDIIGNNSK